MIESLGYSEATEKQEVIDKTKDALNELQDMVIGNKDKLNDPKNPEITKREGRLAYCRVLKGDSITKIRNRLSQYPEFAYLKESTYGGSGRNEKGFNINPKSLRPGMDLMIPLKMEDRQVEDNKFNNDCKTAINNMKSNSTYGEKMTTLIKNIGVDNLAKVMSAFARVETANGDRKTKIGTGGLYRYESTNLYSVSYYHVVPRSGRAGDRALKNLNMNIGDTCNPIKAGMLFLGFWCESETYIKSNFGYSLESCLNPKKSGRYNRAAKVYNSKSNEYAGKLKNCY